MFPAYQKLVFDLPASAPTAPPKEFRIFAYGKTATTKGEYDFDDVSADAVMKAAAEYGNRLTIDYEHMALSDPPQPSPAAASFVLERRADGIWATDVHWTEKAAAMLSAREYLFFSPAFTTDDAGRPSRLLNVALTNLPATKNMQPLVAANQSQGSSMKTVLSALSLKDNASEAEALSAVSKISDERAQLLKATGKESLTEALGVLSAWKLDHEKVVQLTAELETVKAEKQKAEIAGLLDEAVKDGRVSHAKRGEMQKLADDHGVAALRTCLSVISKAPVAAVEPQAEAPKGHGFDEEALKVLKALGQDPIALVEHRNKKIASKAGE